MKIVGTMRALDAIQGAVRVEDVYPTDIDDLWETCTTAERLGRWVAQVSGHPQVGATVEVVLTSTWAGSMRIEACDAPQHLLLTARTGTGDETQIEAWLTAEGARSRLVVEERGLPTAQLPHAAAGWQVHLEDLATSLAGGGSAHADGWSERTPAPAWRERWTALTPAYQDTAVH